MGRSGSTQVCFGRGMWCWWILQILAKEVRCQSHRRRVNFAVLCKYVLDMFGSGSMEISISLVFLKPLVVRVAKMRFCGCLVLLGLVVQGKLCLSFICCFLSRCIFRTKVVEGITLSPKQREQAANLSMRTGQTQGTDQKDRDFDICAILCTWTPPSLSLSA